MKILSTKGMKTIRGGDGIGGNEVKVKNMWRAKGHVCFGC